MRITPIILIFIGLLGMIYPEKFLDSHNGGGRWVFVIVIVLGLISMWRIMKKSKKRNDDL